MRILGLSAYYHDSAACLVEDGVIVAAAQEERFTRKKHDAAFPRNAARYCLAEGRGSPSIDALDAVVFYDKPILKFDRLLEIVLLGRPARPVAVPAGDAAVAQGPALGGAGDRRRAAPRWAIAAPPPVHFAEHHESHAASAFYPSPVRRGRDPHPRRRRGVVDDDGRHRRGQPRRARRGDALPALAGPALLGVHLLHRLPRQLRRVQADGPRALRRAGVPRPHPRPSGRPQAPTARSASTSPTSTTSPAGG